MRGATATSKYYRNHVTAREVRAHALSRLPVVVPNWLTYYDSKLLPALLAFVATSSPMQTSDDMNFYAGLVATLYCAKEKLLVWSETAQRRSKIPLSASSPKRSIIP
jgi:hypothetical protein